MITLILNEEEFELLEEELVELNRFRAQCMQPKGVDYNSKGLRLIRSRATIEMPLGKYQKLLEEPTDET